MEESPSVLQRTASIIPIYVMQFVLQSLVDRASIVRRLLSKHFGVGSPRHCRRRTPRHNCPLAGLPCVFTGIAKLCYSVRASGAPYNCRSKFKRLSVAGIMLRRGFPAVLIAIYLLGISCSRLADAQGSNAAIAQTLQGASNNPQIVGTSAKTGGAAAPSGSPAAASNQAATAQSVQPTSLQASDVNKALLQATNIATQVLQNAPPAQA